MLLQGVGVDIVKVRRFKRLSGARFAHVRAKLFTPREQEYCLRFKDAATHFAGTFAAKEAAFKAHGGTKLFTDYEIRRNKAGKPQVWKKGRRLSSLVLSISHAGEFAVAVACATSV
jgi:holo-[acyl-carrier protein] synthase